MITDIRSADTAIWGRHNRWYVETCKGKNDFLDLQNEKRNANMQTERLI
jgi:hypothetical protein